MKQAALDFTRAVEHALVSELPAARELRRQLHADPETGWQEYRTSAAIVKALSGAAGLTLEPLSGTGLLVRTGKHGSPAIGIRAELDALPLREQTGAAFAASGEMMHACGHDVHMAALVALLRAAGRVMAGESALAPPAALLGVFQPSEEAAPSGAASIARTGRLQAHGLAAMLAVHVHPDVDRDSIGTGAGPVNAGSDSFTLTVTGAGGHAAYPHHSRDPVFALSQIVVALQQVVSRRTDPMHPTVVSVCRLQAGSAANVIPSEAIAEGTVRVLHPGDREHVLGLIREVAEHTAVAAGCQVQLDIVPGDPALVNESTLVAAADPWLGHLGLTVAEPMRSCGSDDFAFYSELVPGLMMFLGVRTPGDTGRPGLHHPAFLPPDDAVDAAARVMLAAFTGAAAVSVAAQD